MIALSACPVCEEKDLQPYLEVKDYTLSHETFRLSKCASCGFVMTNPRPDNHTLPAYYESEKYISHADKASGLLDTVYNISRYFTMRWKYNIVRRNCTMPPASLLDFGCGTGVFLRECEKHNITTAGIEPSLRARTYASKHLVAPVYPSLAELPPATYDAITAWHVLEHVTDFHETLRSLKSLLTPDGRLFIAVPNLKSHDAQSYGSFWAGYDVPRSEERRVGKECRSRWEPDHLNRRGKKLYVM